MIDGKKTPKKQRAKARPKSSRSTTVKQRRGPSSTTKKAATRVKTQNTNTTAPRVLLLLFVATAIVRLFQLQIVDHQKYETIINSEHTKRLTIAASRGGIYFHDGRFNEVYAAAISEPEYTLYADPAYIDDESEALELILRTVPGLNADDVKLQLSDKGTQYTVIAKSIPVAAANNIRANPVKGLGLIRDYARTYLEEDLAKRIIGFVNDDGEGQYGIEGFLDQQLGGQDGKRLSPVDVDQNPIATGNEDTLIPVVDGKNVVTTLDRILQDKSEFIVKSAMQKYGAESASVVIMDTNNSEVIAMTSAPTLENVENDTTIDYTLFQSPATYSSYEPGSVLKTLTIAAGIDSGAVKPESEFLNTGEVIVDGEKITNVYRAIDGQNMSMNDVLAYSLNTGTVFVLGELGGGEINSTGKQKLYDFFTKVGLGSMTGIEQVGETPGLVRSPQESRVGGNIRYANMSFGQGLSSSQIQVCAAYSSIINDGLYNQPTLIKGYTDGDVEPTSYNLSVDRQKPERVSKSSTSSDMKKMLSYAASKNGSVSPLQSESLLVGGKTGTAQIPNPSGGYYEDKFIGGYVGFVESAGKSYTISVRIDAPKVQYAGSDAAAPVFTQVAQEVVSHYGLGGK